MLFGIKNGREIAMIGLDQLVMDSRRNPRSHIADRNTRHMVMQVLEWMWCLVFRIWIGSILVFGVSNAILAILLMSIFITVRVFELAQCKPAILMASVG